MPRALITSAVLQHQEGEHTRILRKAGFDIVYADLSGDLMTEGDLIGALSGVAATLAGSEPYSARVIAASPELRVIARTGVGYDAVDVAAATERKVPIGITPGTNQESVAEQTFALLLGVAKNVPGNHRAVADGGYPRVVTLPLDGQTLGIYGLGRAGKAVAHRAIAFGMSVLAFDPFIAPGATFDGVKLVTVDELLAKSDYLSLHAPLTPETKGFINAATIAKMKDGAIVINTARGGMVDEPALAAALASGKVGGAGLDVTAKEPPVGSPLLSAPNVVFSPHLAGIDSDAVAKMANMAAQTVVDLYEGRWPAERLVNAKELGSNWVWSKTP